MNYIKSTLYVSTAIVCGVLSPLAVGAQTLDWFKTITTELGSIVGLLIPIFIALAFLVFVWGLITFIFASGDDDAKAAGKNRMIWGVLALFVITAIWGILALLRTITGASDNTPQYPSWSVS
ncbi:MAG: hypothetical protein KBD24_03355 [Candidatus Pacebacteria bacterium]|nr:hypothetical protein [Candidatus Paceibacterota bacterium]